MQCGFDSSSLLGQSELREISPKRVHLCALCMLHLKFSGFYIYVAIDDRIG